MWSIPRYPDPRPPYEITGAGDAFASTIVSALVLGLPLHQALLWGPVNASAVIQEIGAQKGLLTREQLEQNLKTRRLLTHSKKCKEKGPGHARGLSYRAALALCESCFLSAFSRCRLLFECFSFPRRAGLPVEVVVVRHSDRQEVFLEPAESPPRCGFRIDIIPHRLKASFHPEPACIHFASEPQGALPGGSIRRFAREPFFKGPRELGDNPTFFGDTFVMNDTAKRLAPKVGSDYPRREPW